MASRKPDQLKATLTDGLPFCGNHIDSVALVAGVAEPSSLALMAGGLIGLLGLARRIRRQS